MKKLYENFSEKELVQIILNSNSYEEALCAIGYKPNNANRKIIKNLAI